LLILSGFVEILNAGFVDQCAAAMPYFDNVLVIPFDKTLNRLPVVQYEGHQRLGLHLLLKVEDFGVGAFFSSGGILRLGWCAVSGESGRWIRNRPLRAFSDNGGRTNLRGPVTAGVGIVAGALTAGVEVGSATRNCLSRGAGTSDGLAINDP
jgi:hypothetical protein